MIFQLFLRVEHPIALATFTQVTEVDHGHLLD